MNAPVRRAGLPAALAVLATVAVATAGLVPASAATATPRPVLIAPLTVRPDTASLPPDPANNIAPSPDYFNGTNCEFAPTSSSCVGAVLAELNHARRVLGQPDYALPPDFSTRPAAVQLLDLTNADRKLYGLPPVLGINTTLSDSAQQGIAGDTDPPPATTVDGVGMRDATANWAAGMASPLFAYYEWMYDDGPGSGNLDCPSGGGSGCWGHRHDVLWSFATTNLVMGVGTGASPTYHVPAWATLYESFPTSGLVSMFPDVQFGAAFFADITWLGQQQITGGYPDGNFHPTVTVSRQEMAAFLYRFANPGAPEPTCGNPFPDVRASNQFCGYISWLKTSGVTSGYGDGFFHPGWTVGRQEMGAYLYRLANPGQAEPACGSPFPDVRASNQFCGYISWLKSSGITSGYGDGLFHPTWTVARQEMAHYLHAMAG